MNPIILLGASIFPYICVLSFALILGIIVDGLCQKNRWVGLAAPVCLFAALLGASHYAKMPKELVVVKDTYTELSSKKDAMRLLAMQKELTPADYNTLQAYIEDVKALQTSHEELTQEAYARLLAIICETPDYLSISTLNVTPIHDITVKWGNKNIEIKKIDSATREEITGLSIDYAGREIIGIPLDS